MSVQIWTFIFIALTFSLYIGIAIWSRAGSTNEFYVTGNLFFNNGNYNQTVVYQITKSSGYNGILAKPLQ